VTVLAGIAALVVFGFLLLLWSLAEIGKQSDERLDRMAADEHRAESALYPDTTWGRYGPGERLP
jgi:hypothetical protein